MLTEIQIFRKVTKHLLTQRSKSKDKDGCLYRAKDGKSCAVGCLIKKKFYRPEIEGRSVTGLPHGFLEKSGIPTVKEFIDLLKGLQYIHDESHPNGWKRELTELYSIHFKKTEEESIEFISTIVKSIEGK